jgi:hypothetical protein
MAMRMTMIIPITAMHHGDAVDDYCRLLPCYAQSSNKKRRGMMAMKDRKALRGKRL